MGIMPFSDSMPCLLHLFIYLLFLVNWLIGDCVWLC